MARLISQSRGVLPAQEWRVELPGSQPQVAQSKPKEIAVADLKARLAAKLQRKAA